MFGFKASLATDFPGITDSFKTFFVPLLPKTVCKIKWVKTMYSKKSQCYNAKTQYRTTKIMVEKVRNIFNLPAQLGKNRIIDHKIALFLGSLINLNRLENLAIGFLHKRPPAIRSILFESIEGILSGFRPVLPVLFTETVNRFYFQQCQYHQDKQNV
jgi:hypothetical protein